MCAVYITTYAHLKFPSMIPGEPFVVDVYDSSSRRPNLARDKRNVAFEKRMAEERLDTVDRILVKQGDGSLCGGWWINCMTFPSRAGW